jgi:hypothetical protein
MRNVGEILNYLTHLKYKVVIFVKLLCQKPEIITTKVSKEEFNSEDMG